MTIIFVLGLCFGSFVNMLMYRTAVRYKLKVHQVYKVHQVKNKNRSFCDYCGKQLNWYENVPVISWLILKGKTKCCHKKLPLSYPIVELITAVLLTLNFKFLIFNFQSIYEIYNFQFLIKFILTLLIIVFLVFSTVFDLKYMILPDFSTFILVGCSIFLMLSRSGGTPLQNITASLVSAGFLLILNLITKGKGMGMGDVKLAIFMGLFLGFPKIIVAFYVAFIVGAIIGVLLMVFKKAKKKTQIPFGPFLILGTFVSWWWGEIILKIVYSII